MYHKNYTTNKYYSKDSHQQKIPILVKISYSMIFIRTNPYIDSSIYNNFLNLPLLSEWLETIHQLPNNKALDPFQISNEMLKHLGPST